MSRDHDSYAASSASHMDEYSTTCLEPAIWPTPDMGRAQSVGVDIVEVNRFNGKQDNERFLERVFTRRELRDAGRGAFRTHRLAARWAVKEAVSKALGCGLGADLGWQEVELHKDREGRPSVRLTDNAFERHDRPEFAVSVAHDGDYAVAFVVLRERNPL